jgi:hypothetical protein
VNNRRRAAVDQSRYEVIQSNVSSGFESSLMPNPVVGDMTQSRYIQRKVDFPIGISDMVCWMVFRPSNVLKRRESTKE